MLMEQMHARMDYYQWDISGRCAVVGGHIGGQLLWAMEESAHKEHGGGKTQPAKPVMRFAGKVVGGKAVLEMGKPGVVRKAKMAFIDRLSILFFTCTSKL